MTIETGNAHHVSKGYYPSAHSPSQNYLVKVTAKEECKAAERLLRYFCFFEEESMTSKSCLTSSCAHILRWGHSRQLLTSNQ